VLARPELDQLILRRVRVLELVNQDMRISLLVRLTHIGVIAQEAHRRQDEIVKVQRRIGGQDLLIALVDAADRLVPVSRRVIVVRLNQLVLGPRDRVQDSARRIELFVEIQIFERLLDYRHLVVAVKDGKAPLHTPTWRLAA